MGESVNYIDKQAKVVLLGESGVGKTSIISRYLNDKFDENCLSTHGASYSKKTLFDGNIRLNLDIWDTVGEEKFRSISKIFYRESKIVILVFDITKKETFEEIQNYWYKEVIANSPPGIVIGLAATKSDLIDIAQVDEKEMRRYAKSINAIFRRTSAKENTGIDELFENLTKYFLNPNSMVVDNGRDSIMLEPRSSNAQQDENQKGKKKNKKCC